MTLTPLLEATELPLPVCKKRKASLTSNMQHEGLLPTSCDFLAPTSVNGKSSSTGAMIWDSSPIIVQEALVSAGKVAAPGGGYKMLSPPNKGSLMYSSEMNIGAPASLTSEIVKLERPIQSRRGCEVSSMVVHPPVDGYQPMPSIDWELPDVSGALSDVLLPPNPGFGLEVPYSSLVKSKISATPIVLDQPLPPNTDKAPDRRGFIPCAQSLVNQISGSPQMERQIPSSQGITKLEAGILTSADTLVQRQWEPKQAAQLFLIPKACQIHESNHVPYPPQCSAESNVHRTAQAQGIDSKFVVKALENSQKMKVLAMQLVFHGTLDYWCAFDSKSRISRFKNWRKGLTENVEKLPSEYEELIAVWLQERTESLTVIIRKLRRMLGILVSDPCISMDTLRKTVLKVANRRLYGIKPFHTINKNEEEDGRSCRFIWEFDSKYVNDSKMSCLQQTRRKERNRIQLKIKQYWQYIKKLRSDKKGIAKESILQEHIDRLNVSFGVWERREERERRAIERRKMRMKTRERKLTEDNEIERTPQQREEKERVRNATAKLRMKMKEERCTKNRADREKRRIALEIKKKKALEIQKKEAPRGRNLLLNYLRANENSNTVIHKNMKFLPFTRRKSFVYGRCRRQTLSSTVDLFDERSFDFVSKQLLRYRTNS